jgi:peptidoglycan hydrolase-like protein with peptidoglycan-binding domain
MEQLLALIALLQSQIRDILGGGTGVISNATFTRDLTLNSEGEDVRALQRYLNTHGYQVSLTGPGSSGFETSFFGPATQAALIKFQIANNISPAVGYFGSITRSYMK